MYLLKTLVMINQSELKQKLNNSFDLHVKKKNKTKK